MREESLWQISQEQIEQLRQQMVKFAYIHLKNSELAEDVVQDALANAYKYASSFKGESALKTWLFAILKNKIVDMIKAKGRLITVSELAGSNDQDFSETLFNENGAWNYELSSASEWRQSDSQVYSEQFWQVFEQCLNRLPANQARVFMMRTYLEMESDEICRECEISTANLHTMLYRARLQLQSCLNQHWFGDENAKL